MVFRYAHTHCGTNGDRFGLEERHSLLELGCGEGRDARALLNQGLQLDATDISPEAIRFCRDRDPEHAERYFLLDCVNGETDRKYDFIFAVAVLHMLVADSHRAAFYSFIRNHLSENGSALVCTMGDGTIQMQSDPDEAYSLQQRRHGATGEAMLLPSTSCRMVLWEVFFREIADAGLEIMESGLTEAPPDFPQMMYAVMRRK